MPIVEHLQMIQSVIDRHSAQSSRLKAWAVTIIAALLSVATAASDRTFAVLAVYALVALAGLDAYYLALERAYRGLYDDAVAGTAAPWQLSARKVTWSDVAAACTSPSVFVLHGLSLAAAVTTLFVVL